MPWCVKTPRCSTGRFLGPLRTTKKKFNIIQTSACEAVEECLGVPGSASELTSEAFCRLSITIETRWGRTTPLVPTRGMVQGSVSGPEQTKPAQSPILALRAMSNAYYRTSRGRDVRAAGFVDDTQHYGSGGADLCTIMGELSRGSIATGIGYAWNKFTAYSSDCEKSIPHYRITFFPRRHPCIRMGHLERRYHKRDCPQSAGRYH